jgi:hypothetical protein
MKWFKHDAHSLRKASIERLILEFGIEGYGLYYACMELIAGDISIDNLTFELEHDAELIANKFKMDTIKVGKIMHRCIELNLFELQDNGKISCYHLARMLDETITKNVQVREIKHKITAKLDKFGVKSPNSGEIPELLRSYSEAIPDQKRIEENRIEKNRKENRESNDSPNLKGSNLETSANRFIPPTTEQVRELCAQKNYYLVDPDEFVSYWTSMAWTRRGGAKIKDWVATVRNAQAKLLKKQKQVTNSEDEYIKHFYKD